MLGDPAAIILDTETTGLDDEAEIIEIAAIDVAGQMLLNTLVKPQGEIPAKATAVHGITAVNVAQAPAWPTLHGEVLALIAQASRVVTYNADFDYRLLCQTARRYGLGGFDEEKFECAMSEYAAFVGELRGEYEFRWWQLGGGHRALEDCRATLGRLREMARG